MKPYDTTLLDAGEIVGFFPLPRPGGDPGSGRALCNSGQGADEAHTGARDTGAGAANVLTGTGQEGQERRKEPGLSRDRAPGCALCHWLLQLVTLTKQILAFLLSVRDLAVSARFRAWHWVADPLRATRMLMSVE